MDATITQVTLIVKNQAEAVEFYTKKLGFEKKIDFPTPNGFRWVVVGPAKQDLGLALAEPPWASPLGKTWKAGEAPPIVIDVEDCQKTCDELRSKGVQIRMEPTKMPYGTAAFIADPDGNLFEISQSPHDLA